MIPWHGLWIPWWLSALLILLSLLAMGVRRHPDVADVGAAGVIVFGAAWLGLTLLVLIP